MKTLPIVLCDIPSIKREVTVGANVSVECEGLRLIPPKYASTTVI